MSAFISTKYNAAWLSKQSTNKFQVLLNWTTAIDGIELQDASLVQIPIRALIETNSGQQILMLPLKRDVGLMLE